jgi:hypothetical protein
LAVAADPANGIEAVIGFTIVDTTNGSPIEDENRYNCATDDAAVRLQAKLATLGLHPVMTRDYPQSGWGGPNSGTFQQEGPGDLKVPYMDFTRPDGTIDHENVGGILIVGLRDGVALMLSDCTDKWFAGDN